MVEKLIKGELNWHEKINNNFENIDYNDLQNKPPLQIEYGNWTPEACGTGALGSPSYASQKGVFYRIGRMVVFSASFELLSTGGMLGELFISGLPYIAVQNYACQPGQINGINVPGGILDAYIADNVINLLARTTSGNMQNVNVSQINNNCVFYNISGTYIASN